MQAVILAAGKGTRLGKLTHRRSKAMQPILGKPILQRVLDILDGPDVDELIVVYNPADVHLQNYFKSTKSFSKLRLVEQSEAKGTAHALRCAVPVLQNEFVLTACDSLFLRSDLQRMFDYWRASASLNGLLALQHATSEQMGSSASVTLSGAAVTTIVEKPGLIDAMPLIASVFLYCFSQKLLEYLDDVGLSVRGEYEIQDAIQGMIEEQGGVEGIFIKERLSLTMPMDLLTINMRYLRRLTEQDFKESQSLIASSELIPPVYIEEGALIGKHCVIGPNVFIEKDAHIGEGSSIREAVILTGARLPPGSIVRHHVLSE